MKSEIIKIAERLIEIAEILLKLSERSKSRGIWTTIAEWLKRKGNHSVVLRLDELVKLETVPPPVYTLEEFAEREELEGIPVDVLRFIRNLYDRGNGYKGATVMKDLSWFADVEGVLHGNYRPPSTFYIVCIPNDTGDGYGYWIDESEKSVYVDYIVLMSSLEDAIRLYKENSEINNYVFYRENDTTYLKSLEDFLKEKELS